MGSLPQSFYQLDLSTWPWWRLAVLATIYPAWMAAYVLMIRRAWKDKQYSVPLIAASMMWAYEFCFIFIWPIGQGTPGFGFAMVFEWMWLVTDTILLVQIVLYARNSWPHHVLMGRKPWVVVLGTTAVATFGTMGFVDWTGMQDGTVMAIIAVAIVATMFPYFWEARQHDTLVIEKGLGTGLSSWSIWLRALGDLTTAIIVWVAFEAVRGGPERPVNAHTFHKHDGEFLALVPIPPTNPDQIYVNYDGTDFTLAVLSPNNAFTTVLLVTMLACDAWVLSALVARWAREHWGDPRARKRTAEQPIEV